MRHLTSHLANSSGRLDSHREMIAKAFESAVQAAGDLLQAEAIDVMFIASPNEAIAEMGVGGYTYGPHVIVAAIDPDSTNLSEKYLLTTLVHEFHHAMRWRGPGCDGDLGKMLISEGLAQLFEEEVLGVPPMYSQVSITEEEIEMAKLELHQQPCNEAKWFFGADGITRLFGYTLGYQICREYAKSTGKLASELVDVPTDEVLKATIARS